MRPIKFRVWFPERKQMAYTESIDKILFEDGHYYEHSGAHYPFEIMQFTGLLDKNGKEIYDGDIIKYFNKYYACKENWVTSEDCIKEPLIGNVEMDDDLMVYSPLIYMSYNEIMDYISFFHLLKEYPNDSYCEIIGNIYENPELLTNTK